MSKRRIYEVAREFSVSSDALLELLRGWGLEVKSHMSSVGDDEIAKIRGHFQKAKESVKEDIARQRDRMRARTEAPPRPAPPSKPAPAAAATATAPAAPAPAVASAPPPASAPAARPPSPAQPQHPPQGQARDAHRPRGKQKGGRRRPVVDEKAVQDSVRKTLAALEGKRFRRKRRRVEADGTVVEEERVRIPEFSSTAELARVLDVAPNEVIKKCMDLGLMVTMNQRLDRDTIQAVAMEFGAEVDFLDELSDEAVLGDETVQEVAELRPRPPVVTVMGHVDHGKTSLLDVIRRTNVIAGEAGGITQHLGAYEVRTASGSITFLDTPGHEAFSAMRARGAQVTDIVVLVVAADEGVMPQTVEAIDHALAAKVPIIVAINKIDLPGSNPDRVKQELASRGVMVEDWGGKSIAVECSAKKNIGVDRLLEMILLQSELLELKADPDRKARGVVVEVSLDRGRGVVATVIIQEGTLRNADPIVVGLHAGKVRALLDERGKPVSQAGPAQPVRVLGLSGMPQAGDNLLTVADEREAREISSKRRQMHREHEFRYQRRITLADISERIKTGELRELNVVIKGDVDGTVEALADTLGKIPSEEVGLRIIHRGVGPVNLSDVLLAAAANAIIISLHVPTEGQASERAKREGVDIRSYRIIYEAQEDVAAAMKGMVRPRFEEKVTGVAEVRQVFQSSKSGAVAGSFVLSGAITRNSRARLKRGTEVVYDGRIDSLRRFKEDVREVTNGFECGIGLAGVEGLREKDLIEAYQLVEVKG